MGYYKPSLNITIMKYSITFMLHNHLIIFFNYLDFGHKS